MNVILNVNDIVFSKGFGLKHVNSYHEELFVAYYEVQYP